MPPRYPKICVQIASDNPLALVSAIRAEMRHLGISASEIQRFTNAALGLEDPVQIRSVCAEWATISL